MAGLYIHIPFCKKKCFYCDFYSIPTNNLKLYEITINSIIKEIQNRKIDINNNPIKSIYIGGGTPNILPIKTLQKLLSSIKKNIIFDNVKEFTIETNPEFISPELIELLLENGINRISLGVQSFDDRFLSMVGRIAKSEIIYKAINIIKKSNIDQFNIDMIFGYPNQSLNDVIQDLKKIFDIYPTHISYYGLSIEQDTHLYNEMLRKNIQNIDDNITADMYIEIIQSLTDNGYNMYEISNFCTDNNYSLHNLNYWDRGKYYGFGPSATSFDGQKRYTNINNVEQYNHFMNQDKSPIYFSENLDKKKSRNEFIMLSLRKTIGLNIDEFKTFYNINIMDIISDKLSYLFDEEYLLLNDNRIKMSTKGFLIFDYIVSEIFSKLEYNN